MARFIVVQEPKSKWRIAFSILVTIVEAKNKCAAVRAVEMALDPAFKKPYALPYLTNKTYKL